MNRSFFLELRSSEQDNIDTNAAYNCHSISFSQAAIYDTGPVDDFGHLAFDC